MKKLILLFLFIFISCGQDVLDGENARFFYDRRNAGACSINFSSAFTTSLLLTLNLNCASAADMYITNNSNCSSGGAWESFSSSKVWTLASTNTLNTVYVVFRDSALVETNCFNASITHDNISPTSPSGVTLGSIPVGLTGTPSISYTLGSDTGSGISVHQVEIRDSLNSVVRAFANHTSGSSITGLSLTDGEVYTARIKAIDNAGNESSVITDTWVANGGCSPDVTNPINPSSLSLSGSATLTSSRTLSWSASSDNCSLSHYELAIGTTSGGSDIVPWTNIGLVTSDQRTGLSLLGLTNYFTSIKAVDGSGNESSIVTSASWQVTASLAVTGLANDLTPAQFKAWSWNCDNPACTFRYLINTTPTHVFTIEPYGATTSDSQASGDGTYYIHVQAKDVGSIESSVTTVSALIDNTAPTSPGSPTNGSNYTTIASTSPLFSWTTSSDTNGIDHYEVSIGTSSGSDDMSPWSNNGVSLSKTFTGLSLSEGVNYFMNVRAHDQAGNISTVTSGAAFIYDGTAPNILSVTPPTNANYLTGQNLDFIVNFDESVNITNIPQLEITLDSGTVMANYLSGSPGTMLTFRYVVTGADSDSDGINLVSPLDLNNTGTIKDNAGNDSNLTFTLPNTLGITVNNIITGNLEWDVVSYDYGSPGVDTTQTFTLTNNTSGVTGTLTASLTGVSGGKFVIAADTCTGITLAVSASCTVDVTYKWKNPGGVDTASLDVTDGSNSDSVSLQGTKI